MGRISSQRRSAIPATIAFAILFPGFYLYHLLVSSGFPAVLGGYEVFAASFCSMLLVRSYMRVHPRILSLPIIDKLYWSTIVYGLVWGLIASVFSNAAPGSLSIVNHKYIGSFAIWVAMFMVGYLIPSNSRIFNLVLFISAGIMLLIVFMNIDDGVFVLGAGDVSATYQFFSFTYMIVFFVILPEIESRLYLWIFTLISILAFILIGARSELIGVLVAFFMFLNLGKITAINTLGQIVFCAAGVFYSGLLQNFSNNRIFDLIYNKAAGSLVARDYASKYAVNVISDNFLLGSYGSYPDGLYAHNFLSVWVDFGIVGAILYIVLISMPIYLIVKYARPLRSNKRTVLSLSLLGICIILLVFAKSGSYYLIPFTIGYAASQLAFQKSYNLPNGTRLAPRA